MNIRAQIIISLFIVVLSLCNYSSVGATPVKVIHFNADWLYGACPFTKHPDSYCDELPWKTQKDRDTHIITVAKYLKSEDGDIYHLTEVQDQSILDKVVDYMNEGLIGDRYTGYIVQDRLHYSMIKNGQGLFQKNALISRIPMFNLPGEVANEATRDYTIHDDYFYKYIMGQFILPDRTVLLVAGAHFAAKKREYQWKEAKQLVTKIKDRIRKLEKYNLKAKKEDCITIQTIVLGDFNNGDLDLGDKLMPSDADKTVIKYIKDKLNLVNAAEGVKIIEPSHSVGMIDHILIPFTKAWKDSTVFSMPTDKEQPYYYYGKRISDHRAVRVVLRAQKIEIKPTIELASPKKIEPEPEKIVVEEKVIEKVSPSQSSVSSITELDMGASTLVPSLKPKLVECRSESFVLPSYEPTTPSPKYTFYPPRPYSYYDEFGNVLSVLIDKDGNAVSSPVIVQMSQNYVNYMSQFQRSYFQPFSQLQGSSSVNYA